MSEQTLYFEDYQLGHVRVTSGRTITETDFVVHAGHTGDFFPHHMDAEFMKRSAFGQRIAHGTMVFAIGREWYDMPARLVHIDKSNREKQG